jgi:predicted aspartyl protease
MSTFTVRVGIGDMDSREHVYTDALVDTSATYSMFPKDFLRDVQIEPFDWTVDVILADGSQMTLQIGPAYLQVLDREAPCVVVFGNPGVFLIGATALENLGLAADPVNKCLIPAVVNGRPF